ncbi:MAG: hypothetical protein WD995_02530 [Gemmatimonadota bacterium]
MIYLDTHVAAWLYASGVDRMSPEAIRRLEAADDIYGAVRAPVPS